MKKGIVLGLIVILAILSCEKDDICIESTTPNLILRFYDAADDITIKQANNVYVWMIDNDTLNSYMNVSTDSIAIPLDPNHDNSTYIIQQNEVNDTITLNYSRNDIFVSRSCGYKTTYERLNFQDITDNWIQRITIENQTIENEAAAHIHIYH